MTRWDAFSDDEQRVIMEALQVYECENWPPECTIAGEMVDEIIGLATKPKENV